ncbi:MAG TPA: helix-turn-helix domain-containing protein [Mycobacterium sp.]|nr:helix-turn-helix domain-containing protein [Mycobacterium sp.]
MARTRPWAVRVAQAGCERGSGGGAGTPLLPPAAPGIVLELEAGVWAGVGCWVGRGQRWVRFTVPIAYDLRYNIAVRPLLGANQVSRAAVLAVAAARADYAEYATGRNSRPTNERLAADTGLSVRTVQRADAALRLLGVATEVLRGRQRTRTERLASWRVGDRGRGWASVWALHDDAALARAITALSPHPEGSLFKNSISSSSLLTTGSRRPPGAGGRGAKRRAGPDGGGTGLAAAWRRDPHAPPWARRHSVHAWASVLAVPAAAGWVSRDINALIADWAGVHGWVPDNPHTAIGLLGAMLAWHGDPAVRPAALDVAREAAELADARTRVAAQLAARDTAAAARAAGQAALGGAGHTAARAAAAQAAARALSRRTATVAADTAAHHAAVRTARGLDIPCGPDPMTPENQSTTGT